MSRLLTATDLAGEAIRMIGEWPPTESGPDGEKLRIALTWLDLIMGEVAGTERLFSRIERNTLSMPIENGTQDYNLFAILGEDLPEDKIQYIVDAWLEDGDGNRTPLEIVKRQKFEDVPKLDEEGAPTRITIDSQSLTPTLSIFPTPPTTDTNTYTIKFIGQKYAPNVAPRGVTGTQPPGAAAHDFGQAWQRYLICRTAHDTGSGPIVKLGEESLTRFAAMAAKSEQRLLAFNNHEQQTTDPVCDPWGME